MFRICNRVSISINLSNDRLIEIIIMAHVTHLPASSSASDIVAVIEEHGAVIVDDFVSAEWLSEFNQAIQTSIDSYKPYDYGEPEAMEFLGYNTVRLNGLVCKAETTLSSCWMSACWVLWMRCWRPAAGSTY